MIIFQIFDFFREVHDVQYFVQQQLKFGTQSPVRENAKDRISFLPQKLVSQDWSSLFFQLVIVGSACQFSDEFASGRFTTPIMKYEMVRLN